MRPWLERAVAPAVIERAPHDDAQSAPELRRRRVIVGVVLVVGSTLLGLSLATAPGSAVFYPLTLSVAVVWSVGGALSGPLHLGYIPFRGALRRPVVTPIAVGLLAGAVFVLGALVVREIEPLRGYVAHVLAHERRGNTALIAVVTLVNGAAEEVFFRGALFAAAGRHRPVAVSTGVYALVTVATGNPMLVFAGAVVGWLFAVQRRASGGILAPMLSHLTWSLVMLFALPPLIGH